MNVVGVQLSATTEVFTTRARYLATRDYLASFKAIENRLPREPHVFRMLDLDAGAGEFAALAGLRFPYAWIDAYVIGDQGSEERTLALLNAQVGTRFFDGLPDEVPACDAMHVGLRAQAGPHFKFAGAHLEKLKLAIWEWDTSSRLESVTGFMSTIGLDVAHVATYAPGKGWAMYFRAREWSSVTDLTPRRAAPVHHFDNVSEADRPAADALSNAINADMAERMGQ